VHGRGELFICYASPGKYEYRTASLESWIVDLLFAGLLSLFCMYLCTVILILLGINSR
jgi:hypothetical protein